LIEPSAIGLVALTIGRFRDHGDAFAYKSGFNIANPYLLSHAKAYKIFLSPIQRQLPFFLDPASQIIKLFLFLKHCISVTKPSK